MVWFLVILQWLIEGIDVYPSYNLHVQFKMCYNAPFTGCDCEY